jgi:predicted membrane GTPase involved in stress response
MPVVLCINKVDRPDARIAEVVDEVYELFMDLMVDAEHHQDQLEFPIVYASAKAGRASMNRPADGGLPDGEDLEPLFRTIIETIPAPSYDDDAPLQAHVTNLDASNFLGRLALLRVHNGTIRKGQQVAWCRRDGSRREGQDHRAADDRGPRAQAGRERGPRRHHRRRRHPRDHHRRDPRRPDDPRPLPLITVDEPAISMTIGTTPRPWPAASRAPRSPPASSRTASTASSSATSRMRILPTERPDAWEVQGRGELALAILVEQMRREGYELTVGKPQVVTRVIDGKVHEPMERLTIDTPEEYLGAITQLLAARKGPHGADDQPRHRLGPHGVPRALARSHRLPHRVPHRDPRHRASPTTSSRATSPGSARSPPGSAARSSPTAPVRRPPTR